MIRYSIIIPHHNIADLLVRCLESIPDREDIQVIVVDDNSSDEDAFLGAISQVGHRNVEAYVTKEGRGAGYARNVGLKHAKGKWLLFADADDFYVCGFDAIIDSYYDSTDEILYFNTKCCLSENTAEAGDKTKDLLFERYRQENDLDLFRFGYTEPWGKMIRKELVDTYQISFDETRVSNDYLFSIKTGFYAKSVQVVDEPLYVYTIRRGSLATDDSNVHLDKLSARLDAYINVQAFMKSVGYYSSPALSSHILVPLFKNYNGVYRRYLRVLHSRNLSVSDLITDTIAHYVFRLLGKRVSYGDVYSIKWKSKSSIE